MNAKLCVLIVSPPGSLREGLLDLLNTVPLVSQVHVMDRRGNVEKAVEAYHPNIVLLDAGQMDREPSLILGAFKRCQPEARCIVFVQSVRQQASPNLVGADAVILEGTPPEELVRLIEGNPLKA